MLIYATFVSFLSTACGCLQVIYNDTLFDSSTFDSRSTDTHTIEPLTPKIHDNKWNGPMFTMNNPSRNTMSWWFMGKTDNNSALPWWDTKRFETAGVDAPVATIERKRKHAISELVRSQRQRTDNGTCPLPKTDPPNVRTGIWHINSTVTPSANTKKLTPELYTQNRFRKYTGKTPAPGNEFTSGNFDATKKKTHWILPEFTIHKENSDSNTDRLVEWLTQSFVGWHHSSATENNTTEFAIACNDFYALIVDYFATIDPVYNEPRGIWTLDTGGEHHHEAMLLKLLYGGRFSNSARNRQGDKSLVVQGLVLVKANEHSGSTTRCVVEDVLVKTETYRVVESETWAIILRKFNHIRGVPADSVRGCLAARLRTDPRVQREPLRMRYLLQLRPQIVSSLARLMLALHVYNETWKNTKIPRYKDSVHQGNII
jgi:hypothetical protein